MTPWSHKTRKQDNKECNEHQSAGRLLLMGHFEKHLNLVEVCVVFFENDLHLALDTSQEHDGIH